MILLVFRLKGGEEGVREGATPQQARAARRRAGAPYQGVFFTVHTSVRKYRYTGVLQYYVL